MPLPLEITVVDAARALAAAPPPALVDCRQPEEFAMCQIPGAQLVPLGELTDRLADLPADRRAPLIVYCHHGGRSLRAVRWLRSQGYEAAQSLAGGIDQWAVEIDVATPRY